MLPTTPFPKRSDYIQFYRYLTVLTEAQLLKLRNIAIGLLNLSAFSPEEILDLESKMKALEQGR